MLYVEVERLDGTRTRLGPYQLYATADAIRDRIFYDALARGRCDLAGPPRVIDEDGNDVNQEVQAKEADHGAR